MSGDAPPAPAGAIDQPFWDGLSQGELRMPCCARCGEWTWPPQGRCHRCGGWEMLWEPVAMDGVVHAFTWVRHPFTPAMAGLTPFASLLVELPHAGGARLLGVLDGAADRLTIGAAVTGFVATEDGQTVLRWRMES